MASRLVLGEGPWLGRGEMVCHCLLLETRRGLVLVDTGLGTDDVREPRRLGRRFLRRSAPRLSMDQTALAQIESMGFDRRALGHIVLTHLDLDHAGGIGDFPDAEVHLHALELEAGLGPRDARSRFGYRSVQWAHGPRWRPHAPEGERWMGFEAVRAVPGLEDDVLLVPLVGHTAGHSGVAVRHAGGWLLHAGDAYFAASEIDPVSPRCPPGLALFQRVASLDDEARRANQERLRALARERGGEVRVVCAHSRSELDAARAAPT